MSLPEKSSWLGKIAYGVATAAIIAGGSTIITNKVDNVRQDEQLKQVIELTHKLNSFGETLSETDKSLTILNERLRALMETPHDNY